MFNNNFARSSMPFIPRCSYAGHVVPCFDPLTSCKHHDFRSDGRASRAFVFADDLQRPAEWLNHLEECHG